MFLGIQYKIERAMFLAPQKIFKSKFTSVPELNIYNKVPTKGSHSSWYTKHKIAQKAFK